MKIEWYSINDDLSIVRHPPVNLETALALADHYMSRANESFENGEEAVAATMFGFSRSENEFIEIVVNGSDLISYTYEAPDPETPALLKFLKGRFQYQEDLATLADLKERIRAFFELVSIQLLDLHKELKNGRGR